MTHGRDKKYSARRTYFEKRKKLNYQLIESLKAGPCMDCGSKFPPECMDFDHCRGPKKFPLSLYGTRSRHLLLAEIAKCDLVCANCHRIRTKRRLLAKNGAEVKDLHPQLTLLYT